MAAAAAPESPAPAADPPGHCREHHPERRVWFGDLHVHTALSQDASTQGTRNRPRDAYRFARGELLGLQPYDDEGRPLRSLRLARPLDFVAVTDHAELLGETRTCLDPARPGHGSWVCRLYRRWPRAAFFLMNFRASSGWGRFAYCGEGGALCLEAALEPWREIREAAAEAHDASPACRFTSFVGYEWTGTADFYNLHRNVIFASEQVPDLPISYFETQTGQGLRDRLSELCRPDQGCRFLVIPHNSNLSGGRMFGPVREDGSPHDAEGAREQARLEPLVEVMQHKGDSECWDGAPGVEDELCAFEKLPWDGFTGKFVPWLAGEMQPLSFVRETLKEGIRIESELGANPYRLGLIASTDTHLGTPGAISEEDFPGHGGAGKPARTSIPVGLPDDLAFNPGGLAAVWAEENSRESLFAALQRREVYGTSGPRIVLRFFGGAALPEDFCVADDGVRSAYRRGVPMGGRLPAASEAPPPRFGVWAQRDPGPVGRPGARLERIQIVKGWVEDGAARERVVHVVGAEEGLPGADPRTCVVSDGGHDTLCGVWADPDFDADQHAFYYARVLETPTCRWSQHRCVAAGVRCGEGPAPQGFEDCCSEAHRPLQRERAWSSPIWYSPGAPTPDGAGGQ